MTTKEINEALASLQVSMNALEEEYNANGGEITETTEQMEGDIQSIRNLITEDGVDSLGRWLKSKEDEKKALKAEKDYVARRIDSVDKTIDYIKAMANRVMVETGVERVKGKLGYSFTAATSTTTSVDKDILKEHYLTKVEDAIRAAGVPAYVGVTLTASYTKIPETGLAEGDADLFQVTERPTTTFRKPKASKED